MGMPSSLSLRPEPFAHRVVPRTCHSADRDETHSGFLQHLDVVQKYLIAAAFEEVRNKNHSGVAWLLDLRRGLHKGLVDQRAAAQVGANQHLEGIVYISGQIDYARIEGEQMDIHARQSREDRRQDGTLHHGVDHRPRLINNNDHPRWRRFRRSLLVEQAIHVQSAIFRIVIGEILPDGAAQIEVAEHALRRDGAVELPLHRLHHLNLQNLRDFVDIAANQRPRILQRIARQIALVVQELFQQSH